LLNPERLKGRNRLARFFPEVSMSERLSEERRRVVFAALVAAQDQGLNVTDSREKVAAEHQLALKELLQIEKEGLNEQWPPLDS
jgi:hypothetical protein